MIRPSRARLRRARLSRGTSSSACWHGRAAFVNGPRGIRCRASAAGMPAPTSSSRGRLPGLEQLQCAPTFLRPRRCRHAPMPGASLGFVVILLRASRIPRGGRVVRPSVAGLGYASSAQTWRLAAFPRSPGVACRSPQAVVAPGCGRSPPSQPVSSHDDDVPLRRRGRRAECSSATPCQEARLLPARVPPALLAGSCAEVPPGRLVAGLYWWLASPPL